MVLKLFSVLQHIFIRIHSFARPFAYPRYPAVSLLVTFCFKRWFPNKELITKDTQTPQVHLFIMGSSLYHLWRQVVQCSTQSGSPEEGKRNMQQCRGAKINLHKQKKDHKKAEITELQL